MTKINPVVLSGGSGTRLWPLSRKSNPKQFLNFFSDKSLFQNTILRTKDIDPFNPPIIVCAEENRFLVNEHLKKIEAHVQEIILEPFSRNTAPAIAVAALQVISKDPKNDLMLVMPSDHLIQNENEFILRIKEATEVATKNHLVTFGIIPDKLETGYGYIKKSKTIKDFSNVFEVEKFIEKPNASKAKELIKDPDYFWNSGIFLFRASSYLRSLQKFQNKVFIQTTKAYNSRTHDLNFIRLNSEEFDLCPNISVDYAVMEKADNVVVMPINIGWSDVGSWNSVADLSKKEENKNSFFGDVVGVKTKNCYINSNSQLVTTIGVENLIIISVKDALLIINKNNSQEVKELFEILKGMNRDECNNHTTSLRPWGSFETIETHDRFKVKRITVNPNSSLSLQMHNHRAEHWVVVKGAAHVTCDKKEFVLTEDQSTYIPIGKKHRLENKGKIPLELIEIQTGSYLGEDDIVRFSDKYGR